MVYNKLKGLYGTWQQKCHKNVYVVYDKIVFEYMKNFDLLLGLLNG